MDTAFDDSITKERKRQAQMIARGLQGDDADEDLGKKISVPKEIMLEELSLHSNRGSQMFQRRQRRVEKFTYETIASEACVDGQDGELVAGEPLGTGHVNGGTEGGTVSNQDGADPDALAPGHAAPGQQPEPFNITAMPRIYRSPWEQAIGDDPELLASVHPSMAQPGPAADKASFKSFNRLATPYGGFENASQVTVFHMPKLELPPLEPSSDGGFLGSDGLTARPTFNRTPQGWSGPSGELSLGINLELAPFGDGSESEDL